MTKRQPRYCGRREMFLGVVVGMGVALGAGRAMATTNYDIKTTAKDVLGTFARILKDPRHDKVKLIERSTASKRLFLGWSMCGQHLESIDEHIVHSIESSGSFDPPTMTPAGAWKLLVTVMTIQNKVR
jgi:hypothetical protein